ncbi:MAG TPA: phosphatase [Desulfobacterales bacterium]|nr:phosphatase [Desulfobacterales bacterium]
MAMSVKPYLIDWVTNSLAVGQAPMSYEALEQLKGQGIGAIMNLCAEFCDLHWIEANAGFEVYYFPIPDEETPDLQELEKALDWLDECLYLGKKVLIHCRFGIGRTGTVVNAFLLRKGLGHKLAGKRLKGLKSKPANFDQWWFIRKYGKKEKPLTIREPSLETKHLVDLFPFFADYERLAQEVDRHLLEADCHSRCGREHIACCYNPVVVPFIEAVYLNHMINATLSRVERQNAVHRAAEARRMAKEMQSTMEDCGDDRLAEAYTRANLLCPLNERQRCLIFPHRPLTCRLFDLPPEKQGVLLSGLSEALDNLSRQVYFAFTSCFPEAKPLSFLLLEVVSGRFAQIFFHQITAGTARPTTS